MATVSLTKAQKAEPVQINQLRGYDIHLNSHTYFSAYYVVDGMIDELRSTPCTKLRKRLDQRMQDVVID